jgi:hypothetical protein
MAVLADVGEGVRRLYFNVWRWFLWTALLGAILPIGLLYVVISLINSHPARLSEVAGHGELFIIAAVLVLGELRILRTRAGGAGEALFVICLIAAVLGLVVWGGILGAHKPANDVDFSARVGTIYLVVTLALGAAAEGTG